MIVLKFTHELLHKNSASSLKLLLRSVNDICVKMLLLYPLRNYRAALYKKRRMPLKLNIGCGSIKYSGWINIDNLLLDADLLLDVTKGLPFDDNSVSFIYSEHFLEHITIIQAEKVLKEFKRCLKKGGVIRTAMPELDYFIQKYTMKDWRNQEWLSQPEYKFIKSKSRGTMLNWIFYGDMIYTPVSDPGRHKYIYNEEDFRDLLLRVGFKTVERCEWKKSRQKELCGLETRTESTLILEAQKE